MTVPPALTAALGLPHSAAALRALGEAACLSQYRGDAHAAAALSAALTLLAPEEPAGWLGQAEARLRLGDLAGAEALGERAARATRMTQDAMAMVCILRSRVALAQGRRALAETLLVEARTVAAAPALVQATEARLALLRQLQSRAEQRP